MALNPNYNYYPAYYSQPQNIYTHNSQGGIVWVRDKAEAEAYPMAPNSAVALWDSSSPSIYLKQTDASGRPIIKVFDLVERSILPDNPLKDDLPNYVSFDDIKPLDEAIKAIRSDIEKMSTDLYGIAGKKKPSAKKTETEEE